MRHRPRLKKMTSVIREIKVSRHHEVQLWAQMIAVTRYTPPLGVCLITVVSPSGRLKMGLIAHNLVRLSSHYGSLGEPDYE